MAADTPTQEVKFTLDGKSYIVRPTFEAICPVEAALDQPCVQLASKCYGKRVSLTEIVAIVYWLLKPFGGPDDAKKVGEIIMDEGYDHLLEPAGDVLSRALKGNKEHAARAKAEAERLEAERAAAEAANASVNPPGG